MNSCQVHYTHVDTDRLFNAAQKFHVPTGIGFSVGNARIARILPLQSDSLVGSDIIQLVFQ